MPSNTESVNIPSEAAAIVQQYHRTERPVSWVMALFVGVVVAAALFSLSLIPALLVIIGVIVLIRFPVLRSYGTIELVADTNSEAVRADFKSATPPLLAFQWGLANNIRPTEDGWAYDISYLFGLRSENMAVEVHPLPSNDDEETQSDFELVVTANEQSWGTYTVSLHEQDEKTEIHIRYASDRRFGLRRLPQWFVAERYRDEALTAQGYSITDRDLNLRI